MKKILLILPVATQPRFSRRIISIKNKKHYIEIATFQRDYFELNKLPDNIKIIKLGFMKSGNYLNRIPLLIKSIFKITKLSKNFDYVYIFSTDVLITSGVFIPKRKLVYEIGDIRTIKRVNIIREIYNTIYKLIINRCSHIIVTSGGFKSYLNEKYSVNLDKIKVIENKLQQNNFFDNEKRKPFRFIEKKFVIGIVGLLRYENIISFLKEYKNYNNNFKIIIYGDGPLKERILDIISDADIDYRGQFQYPNHINKIYDNIDLLFTMYNSDDENVRLALPNKLYESMFFNTPILVSTKTYLSELVEKYKIGFMWDQSDYKGLIEFLNSNEFIRKYNGLKNNFDIIESKVYLESSNSFPIF